MRVIYTILVILFVVNVSYAASDIKKTGTFSSLSYHREAGDLLGYEVRIVFTKNGYEGTIQISEGGPDRLILLRNITVKDNAVSFVIPEGSLEGGEFVGVLSATGLTGTITLKNGNKISLDLKRGKSYWD